MKKLLILLLSSLLMACSSTKPKDKFVKSDYEIAEKLLILVHFDDWKEYGLISEPDNYNIDKYLNGFMVDTLDLRNYKFDFKSDRNAKWEYKHFSNQSILDKLKIVDNYETAKTLGLDENEVLKSFIKISRPVYSTDGKYAVVYFNYFYRVIQPSFLESYTAIFFKENGEWTMIKWIYTPIDDK
ncbi:hypothetical protein E0W68_11670 [Flavobacterium salilacus subsp. salilacus]|uniref:hypothetical protein n=1 Tax=Flavobacterium TaxID=237 RepID=UPI0010758116|nr:MULTISPECIES: hypothetical protein [Flavobacterium]KAF2516867.1 hypothetical protein E0W68_11670 [Flavobacterium salilacus subsp. salilacus]MBE1615774.1 hypothetical protein [Flavobacterium sp. SaA2.13]